MLEAVKIAFPTYTNSACKLLCVLAAAAGCITGALTAGFGRVLLWIGTFRTEHLISCVPFLPIAGVCMVWIYQKYGRESSQGMSLIFDAADGTAKRIPLRLIPLLIGSTWLTHLCGGSAGREGVAVQLGAAEMCQPRAHLCGGSAGREGVAVQLGAAVSHTIGSRIPWFRSIPDAVPILTIAGMAAGFSGLFHAPLAAVCFALEVLAIGKLEYRALLPAAIAAVTANGISVALGLETFQVALPEAGFAPLSVPVLLLGISSGIVGGIFTLLLKQGKIYAAKLLPNPVIRIALCGSVLAMFLLLSGHGRYAGLGTDLIALACDGGTIYWFDFLCKLLFTVCTLAIGFQGGEVTPLFAIGACLGAALAPLFGISPVFAAALCYAAVFGSASNTWLAPICIGTEVFGFAYLPYFAVVCTVSRLCNGNRSMYGRQKPAPLFLQGQK